MDEVFSDMVWILEMRVIFLVRAIRFVRNGEEKFSFLNKWI